MINARLSSDTLREPTLKGFISFAPRALRPRGLASASFPFFHLELFWLVALMSKVGVSVVHQPLLCGLATFPPPSSPLLFCASCAKTLSRYLPPGTNSANVTWAVPQPRSSPMDHFYTFFFCQPSWGTVAPVRPLGLNTYWSPLSISDSFMIRFFCFSCLWHD